MKSKNHFLRKGLKLKHPQFIIAIFIESGMIISDKIFDFELEH